MVGDCGTVLLLVAVIYPYTSRFEVAIIWQGSMKVLLDLTHCYGVNLQRAFNILYNHQNTT